MELRRWRLHTDRDLHVDRALKRAFLFQLSILLLAGSPAAAQTSVEVTPLRFELSPAPGSTATHAVTLSNTGKAPVRIRARLTDWDLSRDGAPQFEGAAEGGPYSATSWVRIAPPEQVIDTGKDGVVRFTVSVPSDVKPSGYRTGILFEFSPATGDRIARGGEVLFKSRIGTLIYLNVGEPPVTIDLTDLQVRTAPEQTHVIAVLKNASHRTIRTKGTLTLFDTAGKTITQVPVPDVPVLPESEREVAIVAFEASKPVPPGEYRVEVRLDLGMPALIVGETTLKVAK